ncbi:MAG: YncE family protein [Chthoniobacterales bacterium]
MNNNNGSICLTLSRPFLFCASALFIAFSLIAQASAQEDVGTIGVHVAGVPKNNVIKTIQVGGNPYAIVVSKNNKFVYVTDPLNQTVLKISAGENKVIKTFSVTNPYGIAVTPNGKTLYVTNYLQSAVYAINAKNGEVIATQTLSSAAHPRTPVVTPNGAEVWIDGGDAVKIYVIDTKTNALSSFTGSDLAVPTCVAFSPDGETAYVTDLQNQSIVQFETATESEDAVVNLSYGPTWCRVNPETGTVYADRPYSVDSDIPAIFQFTVIATGVQTVTTSEIPAHFAVTKSGEYLYVPFAHASTTELGNTVVMYDTTTLAPVGDAIQVGNEPEFAAVAPNGKHAYVSNFADGTISVIDTAP